MGGRGSSSSSSTRSTTQTPTAQAIHITQRTQPATQPNNQQNNTQQYMPKAPMQMTLSDVAKLDDAGALALLQRADRIDMPNHLKDAVNGTQELVYTMGLNELPEIMDAQSFDNFMRSNGLTQNDIITRNIAGSGQYNTTAGSQRRLTAQQCVDMYLTDPYNYIAGKHGGNAIGDGAYFGRAGSGWSGWGHGGTPDITAVLNPAKARVVTTSQLMREISQYQKTHPNAAKKIEQMARRTANNSGSYGQTESKMSMYAVMLGYNVIQDSSRNVIIGREALVVKK